MKRKNQKKISFKKIVLDTLFPVYCLSCEREGNWLCRDCLKKIKIFFSQVCPLCENVWIPAGFLCPACRISSGSYLSALVVCTSYENPAIKDLLHKFKYNFVSEMAAPLAKIAANALRQNNLPLPDIIVPVPLHPKRLRWRGFNQSKLLAQRISRDLAPMLEIRVLDILKRKKTNRPQAEVKSYKERTENVRDIFQMEGGSPNLKNKTVLLIDDIATTGATLQECAKVLRRAGAKKVFGAVIARQTLKK